VTRRVAVAYDAKRNQRFLCVSNRYASSYRLYINLKLPANLEAVAAKPFCSFIGNFVPIKQKELNARAKFSANGGNAHGRNKAFCFFLPLCVTFKYKMIL